jgi:hypothetical protein
VPRFQATLQAAERGPGCGIRLPFDPGQEFGTGRAPVRVWVNDAEPFRTTVAIYAGIAWVGLRKDQQAAFGVGPGDEVQVRIEPDDEPRVVDLPAELAAALTDAPQAAAAFERLSFTHRKEYARWVAEAKREQTRLDRAAKAVSMLGQGVRTPR